MVKQMIEKNRDNWERDILFQFDGIEFQEQAISIESELLKLLDAKHDSQSYNMHNGDGKFSTAGKTCSWVSKNLKGKKNPRVSAALKGRPSPNKGKNGEWHHTEETKAKLSAAHKGKKKAPFSDAHKRALSAALKGKKNPRVSAALKGRPAVNKGKCGPITPAMVDYIKLHPKYTERSPETVCHYLKKHYDVTMSRNTAKQIMQQLKETNHPCTH